MPLARRPERADPPLPTDSVSDIAFLLIIFFILTTTLTKLRGFTAELPAASPTSQAAPTDPKTPAVQMAEGKILFNEQEVSLPVLRDRLRDLRLDAKRGEAKVVTLEAAGRVPYQDYFAAMAAISAAGGVVAIVQED
jgi:biopolymer transport protein ExbD